jgi:hypothetical protein
MRVVDVPEMRAEPVAPPTQRDVLRKFGRWTFLRLAFLKWLYKNHPEKL